jgi:hypothetical protein
MQVIICEEGKGGIHDNMNLTSPLNLKKCKQYLISMHQRPFINGIYFQTLPLFQVQLFNQSFEIIFYRMCEFLFRLCGIMKDQFVANAICLIID